VLPEDLASVAVRMKEIHVFQRTRSATNDFCKLQKLRSAFNELLTQMRPSLRRRRKRVCWPRHLIPPSTISSSGVSLRDL